MNYTVLDKEKLEKKTSDNVISLIYQTVIKERKQILIFNNSKKNSEKTAEDISKILITKKEDIIELEKISKEILNSLSTPTRQCKKLSNLVKKGIAFHHSGLTQKQKTIIEDSFRKKIIKVISSTPTLALGLNLPANKIIIKDYKRYTKRGFVDIPISEYHQMSGRGGIGETLGESILNVRNEEEINKVVKKYIFGKPEEIISKLAIEPILKMYMLSLISMEIINTKQEIEDFFANSLYAYQFQDMQKFNLNLFKIIEILKDYNFILQDDTYYMSTQLGKKISELYLNIDTANFFLENFDKITKQLNKKEILKNDIFNLIFLLIQTNEMKPLFRVNQLEQEKYSLRSEEILKNLITDFDPYKEDYKIFLNQIKTTDVLLDWISEAPEDYIYEKYNVSPGELKYKLDIIDWLIYSLEEFSLYKKNFFIKNVFIKLRLRFKLGIKEELLILTKLKGIGRKKARMLYDSNFKRIIDLKKASVNSISKILGEKLANKIKTEIENSDLPNLTNEILTPPKPKEIRQREVSEQEINQLIETYEIFEKQKNGLKKFF